MGDRLFNIRIFQPLVPHYRVGLFRGVGRRYAGRVELIAAERKVGYFVSQVIDGVRCDYHHDEIKVGPFYWMKGCSVKGLRRGDVIIIEGNIRKLAFLWVALCARLRGIGVVWWGLHKMPNQRGLSLWLRTYVMKRLATSILFYNKSGVEWYKNKNSGSPNAFAVGNAIDLEPIQREISYWTKERLEEFQKEKMVDGKSLLLACSRLTEKVRLHEAIRAMAESSMPQDVILAIIGEGPLKDDLMRLADEIGVAKKIMWLGPMYDQHEMAPWFLTAKLYVYPGPVGLGILHALAYGLPGILNDTHNSTEVEVFENGATGLMFKEFDTESLAQAVKKCLSNEGARYKMGEHGRTKVFTCYTMQSMIDNFCEAIEDSARQR